MLKNSKVKKDITFKEWLLELLQDERGGVSIKPVVALFGSLMLCLTLVLGAWVQGFVPPNEVVNAVMIITGLAMGSDTLDKFSYRPKYQFSDDDFPGYDRDRYDWDRDRHGRDRDRQWGRGERNEMFDERCERNETTNEDLPDDDPNNPLSPYYKP